MSEKLINNPLDEAGGSPPPDENQEKKKRARLSFLDKNGTLSPILLIITMTLLIIFKIAIGIFPDKMGGYLGVLVLITVIFLIPSYLFYKFTSRGSLSAAVRELGIKLPRVDHAFLLFFGGIFICAVTFFINLIFRLKTGYSDGYYLYNTFFTEKLPMPDTPFFPIVAFAIMPAICEELVFRGILQASYKKDGFMSAALTVSIMYALISLDVRTFVSNLALGLFLSFILYLTGSLLSCMIINLMTKCFMLFFGTNLHSYVLSSSNKAVFFAVMIGAILLSVAVFSFECSRIFKKHAKGECELPLTDKSRKDVLLSVATNEANISMIICLILFIAAMFIK